MVRRPVRLLAIIVLGLLWSYPASALMATEPSRFQQADEHIFDLLVKAMNDPSFSVGRDQVYSGEQGFWDAKVELIRMENDLCAGEYCPTAIVSHADKPKLLALGWLPDRYSIFDVSAEPCPGCGRIEGVSFVDSAGKETIFGVNDNYIYLQAPLDRNR